MISTEQYVKFIIKYDLTQEQLLTLILLYEQRIDLITAYKEHFNKKTGIISPNLFDDLIQKGLVEATKTGYKIGKRFTEIYVDATVATDEIYKLYPPIIMNGGVNIPLKTMDKKVFGRIYINKIKGMIDEHLLIKEDIIYARDNQLITMGIEKFLVSEQWKVWRELREPLTPSTPQNPLDDRLFDTNNFINEV